MNYESNVRKSSKPVILAKYERKVMSYVDLKEAQATRAAKDTVKATMKGRGKRGRKRRFVSKR